jgi:hypothetical protein
VNPGALIVAVPAAPPVVVIVNGTGVTPLGQPK